MASALLLLLVVAASFTVVRIGAAALELTGMTWEQAKFQALSAFTNAGFTTHEAEAVVAHPIRRRVVSYLIVLGNAGLAGIIGTFAGSVMGTDPVDFAINMAAIALGIAGLLWLARRPRLAQRMRNAFQRRIRARYGDLLPTAEALLRLDRGFALTRIELPARSPAVGRTLAELDLKTRGIQVLAIERGLDYQAIPAGGDKLLAGDRLVIYSTGEDMHDVFRPQRAEALTIVAGPKEKEGEGDEPGPPASPGSASASPSGIGGGTQVQSDRRGDERSP